MSSDEFQVTSEIHESSAVDSSAKPHVCPRNIVTNFVFKVPPCLAWITSHLNGIRVDEDGDLLVHRRNMVTQDAVIAVEQSHSTTLQFVGLQVWRGALVLADFMLHEGMSIIKSETVLELGSGTGLTSIVAAMFAKEVICTDIDIGAILELIKANFARNDKYIKAKYSVLDLDFYARQWSNSLEAKLTDITVVLAADVVYDNDLTEAFVRSLEKIMSVPPKKTVYIALEKRYVFTIADLDCVAPCYDYFMSCLSKAQANANPRWKIDQVPIDFPQYFHYERMKELVLLRISL